MVLTKTHKNETPKQQHSEKNQEVQDPRQTLATSQRENQKTECLMREDEATNAKAQNMAQETLWMS